MKNVLLIVNPVAGKLKSRAALFDIVSTFCSAGYRVTTQITLRSGHAIELAANAEDEGYDMICCIGGDGTFHEVASGVVKAKSDIPVGYIPAGTTNDFADAIGISNIPKQAAQNIVNGKEVKVDIGSFGENQYFTYVASFGAFTDITYSAPQDLKNRLGYMAYMLEGVKDLTEIKARHVKYCANGKVYDDKYIFGGVSNSTALAGGIIKLKKSLVDFTDGKFELIMIHRPKDLIELGEIINGITFQNFESKMFDFMQVSEASFWLPKNINWTLDGEKGLGSPEITIKNLNQALTLIK